MHGCVHCSFPQPLYQDRTGMKFHPSFRAEAANPFEHQQPIHTQKAIPWTHAKPSMKVHCIRLNHTQRRARSQRPRTTRARMKIIRTSSASNQEYQRSITLRGVPGLRNPVQLTLIVKRTIPLTSEASLAWAFYTQSLDS